MKTHPTTIYGCTGDRTRLASPIEFEAEDFEGFDLPMWATHDGLLCAGPDAASKRPSAWGFASISNDVPELAGV